MKRREVRRGKEFLLIVEDSRLMRWLMTKVRLGETQTWSWSGQGPGWELCCVPSRL